MTLSTDAKLNLILDILNDLYAILSELAPQAGLRVIEPVELEAWRRERDRRQMEHIGE